VSTTDAAAESCLKSHKPLPAINQIPLIIKFNPFPLQKRKFARLILPARRLLPISEKPSNESIGGDATVTGL